MQTDPNARPKPPTERKREPSKLGAAERIAKRDAEIIKAMTEMNAIRVQGGTAPPSEPA